MNELNKEPETGAEPLIPDTPAQETSAHTEPVPADPPEMTAAPAEEMIPDEQPDMPEELSAAPVDVSAEIPEPPVYASDIPAETPAEPPVFPETAVQNQGTEPVMPQQPAAPYTPYAQNYPPQYDYRYAAPVMYPQPAPKRKMALGLKILIISMCVLFGISVLGFIGYGTYSLIANISEFGSNFEEFYGSDEFHIYPDDGNENKRPGEDSDKKEDEETEQNEVVIPDIEVKPNKDGIQLNATPNTAELDITEVYDKVIRSTVLVLVTAETGTGSGTGIIATEDGYIITNSHVVLNSRNVQVQVKMDDGSMHDAVVVGFDKTTDLAVLKIEGNGYTPAEFADSDDLRMGQWVIAIGNPGGEQFSGSITRGVVSGLDRSVGSYSSNGMTYIQTDAAINPGNSGGPLVNLYGQVVGINSAKIVSDEYEGMGFAIPTTGAKKIIDDLLSGGYVQGRVRFGITGTEITEFDAYMNNVQPGFMIATIDEDSCFVGTDVQPYDIIIAIDGVDTPTLDALSNALLSYAPGDTATVTLIRPYENGSGGEEFEVEVTLLADLGETQK